MKKKPKVKHTEYYQSILNQHHSVNVYLSSVGKMIEGLNELKDSDVREAKLEILSSLSNLFQLQKLILKKMRIYMYYFEKRDDFPPSLHMDWSPFETLDNQSKEYLVKNQLIHQKLVNPVRNMGYFHLKRIYLLIPMIEAKNSDPASPWISTILHKKSPYSKDVSEEL